MSPAANLRARQFLQQGIRWGHPLPGASPSGRRDGGDDLRAIARGLGRLDKPPGVLVTPGHHGAREDPPGRLVAHWARDTGRCSPHGTTDLSRAVVIAEVLIGDHVGPPLGSAEPRSACSDEFAERNALVVLEIRRCRGPTSARTTGIRYMRVCHGSPLSSMSRTLCRHLPGAGEVIGPPKSHQHRTGS